MSAAALPIDPLRRELMAVRNENVRLTRERNAAVRDKEKVLAEWTAERTRLHEQLRATKSRERMLQKLLHAYLSDEKAVGA